MRRQVLVEIHLISASPFQKPRIQAAYPRFARIEKTHTDGGVTDGTRTRTLRSHNPMPPVPVHPSVSGYLAHLQGFRQFRRLPSSAMYLSVLAWLQYSYSTARDPREAGGRTVDGLPHYLPVFEEEVTRTVMPT